MPIEIREFAAAHESEEAQRDAAAFRTLNESWIRRYFKLEAQDEAQLGDPIGGILAHGGRILLAVDGEERVGCIALERIDDTLYEVIKMAVEDRHQGRGIGRRLLAASIELARALGARRLTLATNDLLQPAIALYTALGFTHIPEERLEPSPYARAGVFMEMDLAPAAPEASGLPRPVLL